MELRQLRQLEAQHRDLMRRRRAVAHELAVLAAGDGGGDVEASWSRAAGLLTALRRELEQHFALEEGAGLLDLATDAAPRLSRRAGRLDHEHADLNAVLAEVHDGLLASRCEPARWQALVEAFERFSAMLVEHERAEEALVREAFMDDLGGGD